MAVSDLQSSDSLVVRNESLVPEDVSSSFPTLVDPDHLSERCYRAKLIVDDSSLLRSGECLLSDCVVKRTVTEHQFVLSATFSTISSVDWNQIRYVEIYTDSGKYAGFISQYFLHVSDIACFELLEDIGEEDASGSNVVHSNGYVTYGDSSRPWCYTDSTSNFNTHRRFVVDVGRNLTETVVPGDGYCGLYSFMTALGVDLLRDSNGLLAVSGEVNLGSAEAFLNSLLSSDGSNIRRHFPELFNYLLNHRAAGNRSGWMSIQVLFELCSYYCASCTVIRISRSGDKSYHHRTVSSGKRFFFVLHDDHWNFMSHGGGLRTFLDNSELIMDTVTFQNPCEVKLTIKPVHVSIIVDPSDYAFVVDSGYPIYTKDASGHCVSNDVFSVMHFGCCIDVVYFAHTRKRKTLSSYHQGIINMLKNSSFKIHHYSTCDSLRAMLLGVQKISAIDLSGGSSRFGPPASRNPLAIEPIDRLYSSVTFSQSSFTKKEVLSCVSAVLSGATTLSGIYTSVDRLTNPEKIRALLKSYLFYSQTVPDHDLSLKLVSRVNCPYKFDTTGSFVVSQEPIENIPGVKSVFANKNVGGGVLGNGCVQEEIANINNLPLLFARVWINSPLKDDEVLYVHNVAVTAKSVGYARSFKHAHDPTNIEFNDFIIYDAKDVSKLSRISTKEVDFMIEKLSLAAQHVKSVGSPLVGGFWGAGAFGWCRPFVFILFYYVSRIVGCHFVFSLYGENSALYRRFLATISRLDILSLEGLLREKLLNVDEQGVFDYFYQRNDSGSSDEISVVGSSSIMSEADAADVSALREHDVDKVFRDSKPFTKPEQRVCGTSVDSFPNVSLTSRNPVSAQSEHSTYVDVSESRCSSSYDKKLVDMAHNLKVDVEALGRDLFLNQLKTDANLASDFVKAVAGNSETNGKKFRIVIPEVLTPTESASLMNTFPEFDIVFSQTRSAGHHYARAIRRLAFRKCLSLAGLDPAVEYTPVNHNFVVCDVGGDPVTSANLDLKYVHSCCPILDLKDAIRKGTRDYRIVTQSFPKGTMDNVNYYCESKAQDCNITAEVCVFNFSTFDMHAHDIADIMVKKRASRGVGVIHFDPMILLAISGAITQKEGLMKSLDCVWKLDEGKIRFSFNDNSLSYVHRIETYLSVILNPVIYSSDASRAFSIELHNNKDCTLFFTISPLDAIPGPESTEINLNFPQNEKDVLVRMWMPDFKKLCSNLSSDRISPREFIRMCSYKSVVVDKEFYEKGLLFAMRCKPTSFTWTVLHSYLTQLDSNMIIGVFSINRRFRYSAEDLTTLSTHIYLKAYHLRWNATQTVAKTTELYERLRSYRASSIFSRMFSLDAPPSGFVYNRRDDDIDTFCDWLCSNQSMDSYIPEYVSLTAVVKTNLLAGSFSPYRPVLKRKLKINTVTDLCGATQILSNHLAIPLTHNPTEVTYPVFDCGVDLDLEPTSGDGNDCFFFAASMSGLTDFDDLQELKDAFVSYLKANKKHRELDLMLEGAGVDRGTIKEFCDFSMIRVCLHHSDRCEQIGEPLGKLLHVRLLNGHYDYLKPIGVKGATRIDNHMLSSSDVDVRSYIACKREFELLPVAVRRQLRSVVNACTEYDIDVSVHDRSSVRLLPLVDFLSEKYSQNVEGKKLCSHINVVDCTPRQALALKSSCTTLTYYLSEKMKFMVDNSDLARVQYQEGIEVQNFNGIIPRFSKSDYLFAGENANCVDVFNCVAAGGSFGTEINLDLLEDNLEFVGMLYASFEVVEFVYSTKYDSLNNVLIVNCMNRSSSGAAVVEQNFVTACVAKYQNLVKKELIEKYVAMLDSMSQTPNSLPNLRVYEAKGGGKIDADFDDFKMRVNKFKSFSRGLDHPTFILTREESRMILSSEKWRRVYRTLMSDGTTVMAPSSLTILERISLKVRSYSSRSVHFAKPVGGRVYSGPSMLSMKIRMCLNKLLHRKNDSRSDSNVIDWSTPSMVAMPSANVYSSSLCSHDPETPEEDSDSDMVSKPSNQPVMPTFSDVMNVKLNGLELINMPLFGTSSINEIRNNCVREYFGVLKVTVELALKCVETLWRIGKDSFIRPGYKIDHRELHLKHSSLAILGGYSRMEGRHYVHEPADGFVEHRWVYNGASMELVHENKHWPAIACDETKLLLEKDTLNAHYSLYCKLVDREEVKVFDFSSVDFDYCDGVPGCGKSQTIVESVSELVHSGINPADILVLTVSKESQLDLSRRVAIRVPEIKVMTLGSFLMHERNHNETCDYLFIDEGLMDHAGALFLAVYLSGANKVHVSGDMNQIPYIVRVGVLQKQNSLKFSKLVVRDSSVSPLSVTSVSSVSQRCTQDAAKLLSPYYVEGMSSTSNVHHSIRTKLISGANDIGNDFDVLLVFTQNEKFDLLKRFKGCKNYLGMPIVVRTVHEYQGNAADKVLVARLERTSTNQVYKSLPHMIVAVSRHKVDFVYATTVPNDPFCQMLSPVLIEGGFVYESCQKPLIRHDGQKDVHYYYDGSMNNIVMTEESVNTNPKYAEILSFLPVQTGIAHVPLPTLEIGDNSQKFEDVPMFVGEEYHPEELQIYHDFLLPDCALMDYEFLEDIFSHEDHHFVPSDMKFTWMADHYKEVEYDSLQPVLNTSMPPPVKQNQRTLMRCVAKRNLDVMNQREFSPAEDMASAMLTSMIRVFFEKDTLDAMTSERVEFSVDSLSGWLRDQRPELLDMICTDTEFSRCRPNVFDLMLKRNAKPKMNTEPLAELPSPQVIAAHCKAMNCLFSPIFNRIQSKVMASLKSFVKLYCGVSAKQFESTLDHCSPVGDIVGDSGNNFIEGHRVLEMDHSRYDKSQDALFLALDVAIMKLFGVSDDLIELWSASHQFTVLSSVGERLHYYIGYQRKSGDSSTYLFNTLVNMAMTAFAYEDRELDLVMAVFSGDDSFLVGKIPPDSPDLFSKAFNMTTKFFQFSIPYFCSKFLIPTIYGWIFVPDPLKLIIKLARKDLVNWEHAEEYRISLKDLWDDHFNYQTICALDQAVEDRYGQAVDHFNMMMALRYFLSSAENFRKLYVDDPTLNLNMDPSRPKLDV